MVRSVVNNNTTPSAVMKRQDAFLNYYAELGSLRSACRQMGLNRQTVKNWKNKDVNDFRNRLKMAEEDFADKLHDISLERIESQKPSHNPTLLIAALNAHHPKYKANNDDKAQEKEDFITKFSKFMKDAWDEEPEVIEVELVEKDDSRLTKPEKE